MTYPGAISNSGSESTPGDAQVNIWDSSMQSRWFNPGTICAAPEEYFPRAHLFLHQRNILNNCFYAYYMIFIR